MMVYLFPHGVGSWKGRVSEGVGEKGGEKGRVK